MRLMIPASTLRGRGKDIIAASLEHSSCALKSVPPTTFLCVSAPLRLCVKFPSSLRLYSFASLR